MIEIIADIVNSFNRGAGDKNSLLEYMKESNYIWKENYTIAMAKDDSKTKVADFMVCNHLNEENQTFQLKREHDFWKKLDSREEYVAVVECTFLSEETELCAIEKIGRDIMRSRKEVPTVAHMGFIWVVRVSPIENLDAIFQLYFKEDHITLSQDESKYYIGWSEKLKDISMRSFVCDPTLKKIENEIVDFSTELEYDSKYD